MSTTDCLESFGAVDNTAHGEDAFIIDKMTHPQYLFVAVADGVSGSGGGACAARMAINIVWDMFKKKPDEFVAEFEKDFDVSFTEIKNERGGERIGETTLTACIISCARQDKWLLRYIAIGDSPIVHCYPGPIGEQFPGTFLAQEVHGRPLIVRKSGDVYAYVDCGGDGIKGRVIKGERVFEDSDIVLIGSDGVPIEKYVLRDLKVGGESQRFLRSFAAVPSEQVLRDLFNRIKEEEGFSDDATMVAIKSVATEKLQNAEELKYEDQEFEYVADEDEKVEDEIIIESGERRQSAALKRALGRASRRKLIKKKTGTRGEIIARLRERRRRRRDMVVRKPDT